MLSAILLASIIIILQSLSRPCSSWEVREAKILSSIGNRNSMFHSTPGGPRRPGRPAWFFLLPSGEVSQDGQDY